MRVCKRVVPVRVAQGTGTGGVGAGVLAGCSPGGGMRPVESCGLGAG